MRAKQFFYVCAGLLMLATAYQIGVRRAEAQVSPSTVVGIAVGSSQGSTWSNQLYVVLANGDVYRNGVQPGAPTLQPWVFMNNVLGGAPIAVDPATMGNLKAKYKDEKDE